MPLFLMIFPVVMGFFSVKAIKSGQEVITMTRAEFCLSKKLPPDCANKPNSYIAAK